MFENLWWVYVSIGILLIGLEIFTPNFIIMWFGIASIITAIPVYYDASAKTIIFTYAITILILTTFVRKITMDWFSKGDKQIPTNTDSLSNKSGIVTEEINLIQSTGKVQVGKEIWSAISDTKEIIPINTVVKVKKPDGVKLIVIKEKYDLATHRRTDGNVN